eukprot:scaffold249995_cov21-Tisochrysis_lutea.AAC.2
MEPVEVALQYVHFLAGLFKPLEEQEPDSPLWHDGEQALPCSTKVMTLFGPAGCLLLPALTPEKAKTCALPASGIKVYTPLRCCHPHRCQLLLASDIYAAGA